MLEQDNNPHEYFRINTDKLKNTVKFLCDPAESQTWNQRKILWNELKIAFQTCSSYSSTELGKICKEDSEQIPKSTYVELIEKTEFTAKVLTLVWRLRDDKKYPEIIK